MQTLKIFENIASSAIFPSQQHAYLSALNEDEQQAYLANDHLALREALSNSTQFADMSRSAKSYDSFADASSVITSIS